MNPFPPPRAYVDWEVPLRPDGTRLVSTRNQRDYEYYISWLADYLYEKEIPIPENQRGLTGFPCFVPDVFDPFAYDDLVLAISEGVSYEEFVEEVLASYDTYLEEMRESYFDAQEEANDKAYFIDVCVPTREQFERTALEMEAFRRSGCPKEIDHADVPYRAVFAKTLKQWATHQERVNALRQFYDQFSADMDDVCLK